MNFQADRLAKSLNIHPGETRLVSLSFLFYFFLCLPFSLYYSAAYALFIDEFGSQGLPYYYLAMSIVVPLVTLLLLQVSRRLPQARYLRILVVLLIIGTAFFWLGAALTTSRVIIFGLLIWKDVHFGIFTVVFWNTANSLFDVRQGRRLFPLLGVAYALADIIGGLLIPSFVALFGTANLILLAAIVQGIALIVQRRVYRLSNFEGKKELHPENPARAASLTKTLRKPFPLMLFGVVALYWITYFLVNTIFYDRAGVRFPDPDDLASFIGKYTMLVGILSLLVDTFLTGRIIERFGIKIGLLSLPVMVGWISIGLLNSLLFGVPMALTFFMTVLLMLTMDGLGGSADSSVALLYQPLPCSLRPRLQSIADGVVGSLATGAAGVLLIVLERMRGIDALLLTILLLPILACWIALIFPLIRQYLSLLGLALERRRLGAGDLFKIDAAGLAILKKQLESAYPEVVVYAAERIEEAEPAALVEVTARLIHHPQEIVRWDTLKRIERQQIHSVLPLVRRCLENDSSARVRGAAASVLLTFPQSPEDEALVYSYLDDSQAEILRQVLVALLKRGCWRDLRLARDKLESLIHSPSLDHRLAAIQVIEEACKPGLWRLLVVSLEDPNPQVRRLALRAAGRYLHKSLWRAVFWALNDYQTRSSAIQALVSGLRQDDPQVLAYISQQFEAAYLDPADNGLAAWLLRACVRAQSPATIPLLWPFLDDPDFTRQSLALASLAACQACLPEDRRSAFVATIESDARRATWILTRLNAIPADKEIQPLKKALERQLNQTAGRILCRLILLCLDPETAGRLSLARSSLEGSTRYQRAFAIEILDASLPREMKGYLLPLWENLPMNTRLERLLDHFPIDVPSLPGLLSEIINGMPYRFESSLQAWAGYAAGSLSQELCRDALVTATASPFPLVQETMLWALARLDEKSHRNNSQSDRSAGSEERRMLTTIEKMLILKTADIFAYTSDEVLAEIAAIVEEVDVPAGEPIIHKGDLGDCLYIVVSGKVRVHDGERALSILEDRQVFGEMALFDREPRSASVTAIEDTLLLRLDQDPTYELMEEQNEFLRGVIRSLVDKLRKT